MTDAFPYLFGREDNAASYFMAAATATDRSSTYDVDTPTSSLASPEPTWAPPEPTVLLSEIQQAAEDIPARWAIWV